MKKNKKNKRVFWLLFILRGVWRCSMDIRQKWKFNKKHEFGANNLPRELLSSISSKFHSKYLSATRDYLDLAVKGPWIMKLYMNSIKPRLWNALHGL